MTRMLNCARFAIAQSIASMTSLVLPRAVRAEHLQVDDRRARRHAAVAVARCPAMMPATCVPWPYSSWRRRLRARR